MYIPDSHSWLRFLKEKGAWDKCINKYFRIMTWDAPISFYKKLGNWPLFSIERQPVLSILCPDQVLIRYCLSYSTLLMSAAETGTKKQKEFPASIMCIVSNRVRCAPIHLRHSKLHNIITTLQGLPSSSQHSTRQHPCWSQALECQHAFTLLPTVEKCNKY